MICMSKQMLMSAGLGLTLSLGGCGGGGDTPDLGQVSGTVTIDGHPAEKISVRFTPADGGRPSMGSTDSNGHYKLVYSSTELGAKVGKHKVSISNQLSEGEELDAKDMVKPTAGKVNRDIAGMVREMEVKPGANKIDLVYP